MPLDVPKAMDADTAMQVGRPKFLLPISEKACPVIFLSFVHLTTSQGACGVSDSPASRIEWLTEDCLDRTLRKAGEEARGEATGEEDRRAWNRRSNGLSEGVGLWPYAGEWKRLPEDEVKEP